MWLPTRMKSFAEQTAVLQKKNVPMTGLILDYIVIVNAGIYKDF